mmetsp:Transcript_16446/g.32481  ORF Transcript_16446/g.32481 Transcript_16446/m.32481 type:complete len:193 (+) Transcript_16446:639-1217(+)
MQDLGSSSPGDNGTVDSCVDAELDAVKTESCPSSSTLLEPTPVETCNDDGPGGRDDPSSSTLHECTLETCDANGAAMPRKAGVPDHPTAGRWCKKCRAFLPLEEFPKGKRRFVCRKHAARPNNATAARARMLDANPRKKALWRLWHYAYLDSRSAFCSAGSPTQADIAALCDAVGLEPTVELRVVPVDPLGP